MLAELKYLAHPDGVRIPKLLSPEDDVIDAFQYIRKSLRYRSGQLHAGPRSILWYMLGITLPVEDKDSLPGEVRS